MVICNIGFGILGFEIKRSKKENVTVHLNGIVDLPTSRVFHKIVHFVLSYGILEIIEIFI